MAFEILEEEGDDENKILNMVSFRGTDCCYIG